MDGMTGGGGCGMSPQQQMMMQQAYISMGCGGAAASSGGKGCGGGGCGGCGGCWDGGMNGASADGQSGVVKHWNDQRGFGFVTADANGQDVYVHRTSITDGQILQTGAQVWMTVTDENGRPVGKNVSGGSQGNKGQGKGCGGGGFSGSFAGDMTGATGDGQSGVVKHWNDPRGFGFVTADSTGIDVYVHRTSLTDGQMLQNGAQVWMTVSQENGKAVGTNVSGASQGKGCGGFDGGGKGKGKGEQALGDFDAETKVWVGNLPDGLTNPELNTHFQTAGSVVFAEVGRKPTYGGVAYSTKEEAAQAIVLLNGSILNGNSIEVDTWTAKDGSAQGGGWGGERWAKGGKGKGGFEGGGKGCWEGGGKGDGKGSKRSSPFSGSGARGNEFVGTIMGYDDSQGVGFIESPELFAQHNNSAMLYKGMKKNFEIGNTVKFSAVMGQGGRPVAIDLSPA